MTPRSRPSTSARSSESSARTRPPTAAQKALAERGSRVANPCPDSSPASKSKQGRSQKVASTPQLTGHPDSPAAHHSKSALPDAAPSARPRTRTSASRTSGASQAASQGVQSAWMASPGESPGATADCARSPTPAPSAHSGGGGSSGGDPTTGGGPDGSGAVEAFGSSKMAPISAMAAMTSGQSRPGTSRAVLKAPATSATQNRPKPPRSAGAISTQKVSDGSPAAAGRTLGVLADSWRENSQA